MTDRAAFPHCDSRVLHAPGECEFCDEYPEWQKAREVWNIAFTGHSNDKSKYFDEPLIPCPSEQARPLEVINRWSGNVPRPKGDHSYD